MVVPKKKKKRIDFGKYQNFDVSCTNFLFSASYHNVAPTSVPTILNALTHESTIRFPTKEYPELDEPDLSS